jgi:hypothetical protein
MGDRPDRPERPDRLDRPERPDRPDRPERPEGPDLRRMAKNLTLAPPPPTDVRILGPEPSECAFAAPRAAIVRKLGAGACAGGQFSGLREVAGRLNPANPKEERSTDGDFG